MFQRFRRLRSSESLRSLVRETSVSLNNLVYPIFVEEKITEPVSIPSMPGVARIPENDLQKEIEVIAREGIKSVILFGVSHVKNETGSDSWNENGLLSRMISKAKKSVPELVIISDNCFCEYTSHGHCGVLHNGEVDNDETLKNLSKQAVIAALAGADIIAPSAMMDGQVSAIRSALDSAGFYAKPVMSYSSKHASSFYGPFRDAAGSTVRGDRKTYQMDPLNGREALRESIEDVNQGADILLVKPALSCLDIIQQVRNTTKLPCAAYQVSGEYSMIKFAAAAGAINEAAAIRETLGAIKRAGADIILTYFARTIARDGF